MAFESHQQMSEEEDMMFGRIGKKSGFTVVELITTVVVVGLVTAMAAPRMQRAYERTQFRSHVKDITSTLRLARSSAITEKHQYGVLVDPEALTVTLFKDMINLSGYDFVTGDSVIRTDTLPPEFVWVGTDVTNNVIIFKPNGAAGYTGSGNIMTLAYSRDIVASSTTNVLESTGRIHSALNCY